MTGHSRKLPAPRLEFWRDQIALLLPPPRITVSEFAERDRIIPPEACATPGKWRNSEAPHLVAVMDAMSPSDPCEQIAVMFSSQTAKTEALLNFIAYIATLDPGPILAVQPNVTPMGERFSKTRIAPMIRDMPSLRALFGNPKSRDSGNTIKIVARYQQFRAVHRAIDRLLHGKTRRQDGESDRRGGAKQPAFAHGDEDHGTQPHETATEAATPAMTAQEALASIQTGMDTVGSQIDAGQFDLTHKEIEKIDAAAKSLKTSATVAEDKKARLELSINQFVAQLGKLHTVTDSKDAEKSLAEFKKAQGALKLVESVLK